MWNGCWSIHEIHSKKHVFCTCKVIGIAQVMIYVDHVMDHYWLDIRYFKHDKMIWLFVVHIIEYVIGTYIYKYVNRQRLALSHEQPSQSICLWVGMRHNILMLINEWKIYKRSWGSPWLSVKMRSIVNDILIECNHPQLHLPIWTRLKFYHKRFKENHRCKT